MARRAPGETSGGTSEIRHQGIIGEKLHAYSLFRVRAIRFVEVTLLSAGTHAAARFEFDVLEAD
jgi:hypothetical protein